MTNQPDSRVPAEIISYYNLGREDNRLRRGSGQLEFARTQELIQRYSPPPPASVLDVGGGSGVYAFWLAELGYDVDLIDAVPLHIEQANAAQQNTPRPLRSARVGDARNLPVNDNSVDVVLLLGPLYHLTDYADRIKTLQEARRVLKPGGYIIAAAISRFASLLDGLFREMIVDPTFVNIIKEDLRTGQHRNLYNQQSFFTTSFFHHRDELATEINVAGFEQTQVLAIEGPGWLATNFEAHWNDPTQRENILQFVKAVESEPTLIGVSSHLMGVGKKPRPTPTP